MTADPSSFPAFPEGFVWGTATASYQIEGAVDADGRGRSVWDTFVHTPGKIKNDDTGDVACDHYHRLDEDLGLIGDLGTQAYRFSIAWPRIQADGTGAPNPRGVAFYDRLVDGLLERGVAPAATLYHWDLPQALEDTGGWLNRDTAERFAEYAGHMQAALGDRLAYWITLNEPFVVTVFGYALGTHAPGRTLMLDVFPVVHHQLLAHGLATSALRAGGATNVGTTNNLAPPAPASDSEGDLAAAARMDLLHNRTFTDPVLLGRYPDGIEDLFPDRSVVRDGDLATIGQPLDFLGVNYYFRDRVVAGDPPLGFQLAGPPDGVPTTHFGWPVEPDGLTEVLVALGERYGDALPPVYVTENGCSYPDGPGADGAVHDERRVAYLDGHIRAVHAAIEAGADVRGYFVWSLMDNFEWAEGFEQRFGLVHVDYPTGTRTPKDSYRWYQRMVGAQPGAARR